MAKALPEWERFEAEQRALSESEHQLRHVLKNGRAWTTAAAAEHRPALLLDDHQNQRLSRNMPARRKAVRHPAQAKVSTSSL
jgi:predicted nucleic acid-binding protein